jgi:hypothetical protein
MTVRLHVVGVDVGDHRQRRLEIQEGRVGLVGFDDDEFTGAEPGMRAVRFDATADDERRIEAAFREHARDETRRGGLAMRAGHRDALLEPHQFGEHECPRHDRHFRRARRLHFGVVLLHRRRHDDRVRSSDMARIVTFEHRRAELLQMARHVAGGEIRAAHLIAEVEQHLGDAGHAGPADAHEVHVFDLMPHSLTP